MTTPSIAPDLAAGRLVEGIVIPGPTGGAGGGSHQVDLTGYYSPGFAIIGVVGMLVVVAVAFVIVARRRLRGDGSRK